MAAKRILVTSALPYANGPIHFGHIAGAYLPADIFVRFMKAQKADVLYVCGTDEHGVAITITAEEEKTTPQELTARIHEADKRIFDRFNIQFDHFSRTTRPHHYALTQQFFSELHRKGHIEEKTTQQLKVSFEIRSYNSRHFDVAIRLPHGYLDLEEKIKNLVAQKIARGRIEIKVQIIDESEEAYLFETNEPKARAYHKALRQLCDS